MRFHREGRRILAGSTVVAAVIVFLTMLTLPGIFAIPILLLIGSLLFLTYRFFRVPVRATTPSEKNITSPADGKIVAIERVAETEYFHDERIQVSIFMSIHNVHKNWYPLSGRIKYVKYHPGKYLVARHPKSSVLNERSTVVISNNTQEILVRQVAGYVARRIVCNAKKEQLVTQADELGFIRFGSRLDLFLPLGTKLEVQIGDRVKGGISLISWCDK